ncbi:MAG: hypothetical protein ACK5AZ_06120 [Bryobacteraceae bacterium]
MRGVALAIAVFLMAPLAFTANFRLYMKDGSWHLVREYSVESDRVRYYSVERSDWEEIPLELVDLKRTESVKAEREAAQSEEAAAVAAETAFEREQRREIARIPREPGVYILDADNIRALKQAESKINNNKGRSVLKVIAPIPIVSGKATIEIDGAKSAFTVANDRPEFYFRLDAEERFGLVRATVKKGVRIVERWDIIPVTNEIMQEHDSVDIFRQQVAEGLYKIWPVEPLAPGEYAVIEFTEGKGNTQIWDFGYYPKK